MMEDDEQIKFHDTSFGEVSSSFEDDSSIPTPDRLKPYMPKSDYYGELQNIFKHQKDPPSVPNE